MTVLRIYLLKDIVAVGGFFTHGYVLYEAGEVLSVREPYQFLRIGCSSRNWVAKVIISHRPCN